MVSRVSKCLVVINYAINFVLENRPLFLTWCLRSSCLSSGNLVINWSEISENLSLLPQLKITYLVNYLYIIYTYIYVSCKNRLALSL